MFFATRVFVISLRNCCCVPPYTVSQKTRGLSCHNCAKVYRFRWFFHCIILRWTAELAEEVAWPSADMLRGRSPGRNSDPNWPVTRCPVKRSHLFWFSTPLVFFQLGFCTGQTMRVDLSPRLGGHTCVPPNSGERSTASRVANQPPHPTILSSSLIHLHPPAGTV